MAILGVGAGTGYPGAIDTAQVFINAAPVISDTDSRMDSEVLNDVLDAILAVQNELGVDPAGAFLDVVARLNDADAEIALRVLIGGQLGGTPASPDVRGIRTTDGPTLLTIGSILDGQALTRVGSTVVGANLDPTREFFYPVVATGSNRGNFPIQPVLANATGRFLFFVPSDFVTLTDLVLVGIPQAGAAGAAKDIDFFSDYGAAGEAFNNHDESNTVQTFDLTGTTDELFEFDISGVYSSLAAGDYAGLEIKHNAIGGNIDYLGIRLRYTG